MTRELQAYTSRVVPGEVVTHH